MQAQRLRARTRRHRPGWVRPHTVLAGAFQAAPRRSPGNESEGCGQSLEKGGADVPQCKQHLANPELCGERR
jgi:hypothetical protein